mmetsp:Transcript_27922/g.65913  ORF Transcript_27922/g.65913 Transcript_27922/m.65913 type:complete len:218 (+) Transcript_27922:222-875(+)
MRPCIHPMKCCACCLSWNGKMKSLPFREALSGGKGELGPRPPGGYAARAAFTSATIAGVAPNTSMMTKNGSTSRFTRGFSARNTSHLSTNRVHTSSPSLTVATPCFLAKSTEGAPFSKATATPISALLQSCTRLSASGLSCSATSRGYSVSWDLSRQEQSLYFSLYAWRGPGSLGGSLSTTKSRTAVVASEGTAAISKNLIRSDATGHFAGGNFMKG